MDRPQAFSILGLSPGDSDEKIEAAFAARIRTLRDRNEVSRTQEAYRTLRAPEALEPGRRLRGRYEIRTRLGSGDFGDLYTAFDHDRDEEVRIEVLRSGLRDGPEVDAIVAAHLAAIESAAALHSAAIGSGPMLGVVRIKALEREDHRRWFVGEPLTGGTLRDEIDERRGRGGGFSVEEVRTIGKALCRTLRFLRGASIVPVLAPEKVHLTSDGQVKLTETGLSRCFAPPGSSSAAPENTPQAAQHSLALLLSEMLADPAESPQGSVGAAGARRAVFPHSRRSDLPRRFASALQRALSPDPSRRFPDFDAFAEGMGAKAARMDLRKPISAAAILILLLAGWSTHALWGPTLLASWRRLTRDPRVAAEVGALRKEAVGLIGDWNEQIALQTWSEPPSLPPAATIEEGDRRWAALRDGEARDSFREACRTLNLAVAALRRRGEALAERPSGSPAGAGEDPVEAERESQGHSSFRRGDIEISRFAYESARAAFEEAREAFRRAEERRADRKAAGEELERVREAVERLAAEEKRIADAVDRASSDVKAAGTTPNGPDPQGGADEARRSLAMLERLTSLRRRALRRPGEEPIRLAELLSRSADELAAGALEGARRLNKEAGEIAAALLRRGEEIDKTVREEFEVHAILDWADIRISRFVPAVPARLAAARDAFSRGRREMENLAFPAALDAFTEAAGALDALIVLVPEEQPTVQQGVYAAEEGEIVRVRAGLHEGSVKMKSGVLLVGDGPESTILRCGATEDLLVAAGCRSGFIGGLTLEHPESPRAVAMEIGEPVKLQGNRLIHAVRSRLTIVDCRLRQAVFGILSSRSSLTIQESRLESCMLAIGIDSAGETLIQGNRIDDFRAIGISVVGKDAAPEVRDNQIRSASGVGIFFGAGARGSADGNTIDSCMYGVYVTDPETAPFLARNVCRRLAASGLYYGKGAGGQAEGNRCEETQVAGIFLENLRTAPTLRENICRSNRGNGIHFTQGAGGTAVKNRCEANGLGILLQGLGTAPVLRENHILDNRIHGLLFEGGAGGVAEGNIVTGNQGSGVVVHESNPTVRKNSCANNRSWGIDASRAMSGSTIEENGVDGNGEGGVRKR